MTNVDRNTAIVKYFLDALAREDLSEMLNLLDREIDWQSPATNTRLKEISWSRPRHSRSEAEDFFKELSGKVELYDMASTSLTAQGDRVFAEGTTRGAVTSTGCFFRSEWAMAFTLRNGKIVRVRHYYDSADIAAAFHAVGDECRAVLRAAA
jgi:uncharacterized protein